MEPPGVCSILPRTVLCCPDKHVWVIAPEDCVLPLVTLMASSLYRLLGERVGNGYEMAKSRHIGDLVDAAPGGGSSTTLAPGYSLYTAGLLAQSSMRKGKRSRWSCRLHLPTSPLPVGGFRGPVLPAQSAEPRAIQHAISGRCSEGRSSYP